jgi:hypothetical protein
MKWGRPERDPPFNHKEPGAAKPQLTMMTAKKHIAHSAAMSQPNGNAFNAETPRTRRAAEFFLLPRMARINTDMVEMRIQLAITRAIRVKHCAPLFPIRNTILQLRSRTTKIWTEVAACRGEGQRRLKRSGDTAFRMADGVPKRRGASLPAAVQNPWLRRGFSASPAVDSAFGVSPRAHFEKFAPPLRA